MKAMKPFPLRGLFLLSLTLILFPFLNGQSDFRPGYIITNQMDTVYGEINYQGELLNSKSCIFRTGEKKESVKYSPGEIYGYRFSNDHFYVSKILPLEEGKEEVFTRYMVDGITNLFFHRGSTGDAYYVEDQDGVVLELDNRLKQVTGEFGGKRVKESTAYIGVLKYLMKDQPQIYGQIDNLRITEKSLLNLMTDYHQMVCGDSIACIIYQKEKKKTIINFGVIAAYYYGRLNVLMGSVYDINAQPVSELRLGAGINFPLSFINHRIQFKYKILYNQIIDSRFIGKELVLNTATHSYMHHLDFSWLENSLSISYLFLPESKIKPYIELGGFFDYAINYSVDSRNTVFRNTNSEIISDRSVKPIHINNHWLGFYFGAGFDIKTGKNTKVSFTASYLHKFDGTDVNTYATMDGVNFSSSYWF